MMQAKAWCPWIVGPWVTIVTVAGTVAQEESTSFAPNTIVELRASTAAVDDKPLAPIEALPPPPNLESRRQYHNADAGEGIATGIFNEVVYSNTGGTMLFPPGAHRLIADDVTTVAIDGCKINAYEILISGGGDGTGPGFAFTCGIYDACPSDGGQLIPGTQVSAQLGDDSVYPIMVDLSGSSVFVPRSFWIGVEFDRAGPGWFVGTPAEVGYTGNVYDHPLIPCSAQVAPPLYAGFYARVYCAPPVQSEFPAYVNDDLDGSIFPPGANEWQADDVELITDNCALSSMEVGVRGVSGPFSMDVELWSPCGPDFVVEGTQWTYEGRGDDLPELARFEFPGGVPLPPGNLWLAVRFDQHGAGCIIAEEAELGYTDLLFAVLTDENHCEYYWFGMVIGYNATIRCLGDPPMGACCDLAAGEPYCRQTPQIDCLEARWIEDAPCDPDPFNPPCGAAACCTPPEEPWGEEGCANLAEDECTAITDDEGHSAIWQQGEFCGDYGQHCIRWVCGFAEGPCDLPHDGVGCEDPVCCDHICAQDGYCCDIEWDSQCAERANAGPPMGCDLPASNDECVNALSLDEFDECSVEDELCMEQNNGGGTVNPEDPGFCCHPQGPGTQGVGSVWYKFVAADTSARIDTCSTTPAGDRADNSLIEVYKALDDSTPEAACDSLVPLACNDDFPVCGPEGGNSRFDVFNLSPCQTHYIQLAAKTAGDTGKYRLRVTMPSPAAVPYPPPANNYCTTAPSAVVGGNTYFDLENATMDCPYEPLLPGMQNDVWFSFLAPQTLWVTVETCTPDPYSDPDTTLAVYWVDLFDPDRCPVLAENRRASNDDAGGDCGTGSRLTFNATFGSLYRIRVGGQAGGEPRGMLTLAQSPDCQPNGIPDACDVDCGPQGGQCDIPGCGLSEDANANGVPDECECADGTVAFMDPADGLWDARQPHSVDDTTPQGYDTFVVTAPERADFADGGCWQLCETNNNPNLHPGLGPNSIAGVTANGDGSYTITLDRPIAPGEVTTITYDNTAFGGITGVTGVFSYLPADVDGDGTSGPADILALIDSLNGVIPLPGSRVDMDRDGTPAPGDILRLFDLLNGAGEFCSWLDASLPSDEGGCP